jgi:hypothetical protein
MARRSIALTPNLERLVHLWQAQSIQALNKDVSFNDALNQMLAWGIATFTAFDGTFVDGATYQEPPKFPAGLVGAVNELLQDKDLENKGIRSGYIFGYLPNRLVDAIGQRPRSMNEPKDRTITLTKKSR